MKVVRNEIRISDFEIHQDGPGRSIYINRLSEDKFRLDVMQPAGSACVFATTKEMVAIAQEILDMAGVTNISFTHPPEPSQ